jgi:hypothetical protein
MTAAAVAPTGTQSEVHHLLQQLGDHRDTMAAELHRLGVTGECNSAERCVLANYLRPRIDCDNVVVSEWEITIIRYVTDPRGRLVAVHEYVYTTDQVAELVVAFDAGAYPQLITRGGAR